MSSKRKHNMNAGYSVGDELHGKLTAAKEELETRLGYSMSLNEFAALMINEGLDSYGLKKEDDNGKTETR